MKKVAIILPPEFRRLGPHQGGLYRWFEAYQKGLLPKPHSIIGLSAGAIAGSACLPWEEDNFKKIGTLIKNLKTSQIFTVPRDVETELGLLAATYLFLFVDPKNWSKAKKFLLHAGELVFSVGLDALLFRQFFKRPSVFSNEPLRQLLKNNLDFEAIFESEIRLEVIAADMQTGKEIVFCNHNIQDQDPERWISAVLGSARLPGRFPPISIDARFLGDGGMLGYAPLHRAVNSGCERIVLFHFTPLQETRPLPGNFLEDIISAAYRTEMLLTHELINCYQVQLKNGANLPPLHIIQSELPLEELTFKNFTNEALVRSMNLGYEAVSKDLPLLQKLVT